MRNSKLWTGFVVLALACCGGAPDDSTLFGAAGKGDETAPAGSEDEGGSVPDVWIEANDPRVPAAVRALSRGVACAGRAHDLRESPDGQGYEHHVNPGGFIKIREDGCRGIARSPNHFTHGVHISELRLLLPAALCAVGACP
jgi:hypothetical protein